VSARRPISAQIIDAPAMTRARRPSCRKPIADANPSTNDPRYPIARPGSDHETSPGSRKYIHIQSGATAYEAKATTVKTTAAMPPATNARDFHQSSRGANAPKRMPRNTSTGQSMMKVSTAPFDRPPVRAA
jgi:hypothetical protein